MANHEDQLAARLEADRRALLDLSLRNPLLNYRPRTRGLEIVGESVEQVMRCLVREGRRMAFVPAPAVAKEADDWSATDEAPVINSSWADQSDHKLQTALQADALQTRLLSIYYAARASLEEQGVNTLFLALGMLKWIAPGHEGLPLQAPLVLVPVELERTSARERFRLRQTAEDLEVNLSLSEKLRSEYGLSLPDPPENSETDVTRYFDELANRITGEPGWQVDRAAIVLGFFSFGKFLMYRDLDAENWPEDAQPGTHPVLRALLREGFRAGERPTNPDEDAVNLDVKTPPEQAFHIVDADGTQALALLDVSEGRNLVIQGPPGTGKSQTITNLIAAAIGRGKTVLFVAEKLAALEVVKRRLDANGLGDACLELHSRKVSKRAVLDEIERTLRLGKPRVGSYEDDFALLSETRDRLNAYTEAIHSPIGSSGVSTYEAVGALLALEGLNEALPPSLDLLTWTNWTPLERKRRLGLVAELQRCVATLGVPREHPLWCCRRMDWMPTESERLQARIEAAKKAILRVRDASGSLAQSLNVAAPLDRHGCSVLLTAARLAAKAWNGQGVDFSSADWTTRRGEIHELVDAGAKLSTILESYDNSIVPSAWEVDLIETRRALNIEGRSWKRWFSHTYHRAVKQLDGLMLGAPLATLEERLKLADAILNAQRLRTTIHKHDPLATRLFGARWQGERSSWSALGNLAKWAARLHHDVRARRLPEGLLSAPKDGLSSAKLRPLVSALKEALVEHRERMSELTASIVYRPDSDSKPATEAAFEVQLSLLKGWSEHISEFASLTAFNRLAEKCRKEALGPVVMAAESWPPAGRALLAAVSRAGYESMLREAYRDRSALAEFDASGHEQAIRRFIELDRLALRHNRVRVALAHWSRLPRHEGGGQLGTLRREFEKKSRHLPVRQLLAKAGRAVQAIKPVFMMSPLSVAGYLEPGSLEFDLVVFDEASQVKPVDALGAILRSKQAVVVGDSRQLPPTTFFDRLTGDDSPDQDEDSEVGDSAEIESILGLFVSAGAPERMLRWHYRSRHESLIAVSNREFYDDRLVVFPSPDFARSETGLVLRHLPGTIYERGGTRTNPGEAEAVAQAVMAHAKAQLARPANTRRTLGVAAFSIAQTTAIRDHLERLRREAPNCEPFFGPEGSEPFFVKHLESVQGDERDVIFISIGYGRTEKGQIAMNFGPLNGSGGERRLNVLFTRARIRCEVFTNLTADDIDLSRTRSQGVCALKTFLAYAQTGRLEGKAKKTAAAEGNEFESLARFEHYVEKALHEAGLKARRGQGEPGIAPDLTLADPDRAGHQRLGLIADGPEAHLGRPARDRDRLRAQVLESLGWHLKLIWSTDWIRDPQGAVNAVRAAAETPRVPPPPASEEDEPEQRPKDVEPKTAETLLREEPAEATQTASNAEPYHFANVEGEIDLASSSLDMLIARLVEVVRIEGPIHRDEAAKRIAEGAGAKRLGTRTSAAIDEARSRAVQEGKLDERGEFLWPIGRDQPVVRDRSALPSASRRLELIAPEEIALAVETVVSSALGMPAEAIPSACCRLLGFPRMSDEMRAEIEAIVGQLVSSKRLVGRGAHLVIEQAEE